AVAAPEKSADLVALDEALVKLAAIDPLKSQIVELRFFGGLSVCETAEVLKIAPSTVYKHFDLAKLWLLRQFKPDNRQCRWVRCTAWSLMIFACSGVNSSLPVAMSARSVDLQRARMIPVGEWEPGGSNRCPIS